VYLAQRKITLAAIAKRMAAVVKTPIPEKASLIATVLDTKIMHKKTVNIPAASENSWLDGCVSVIGHRSLKHRLSGSTFWAGKIQTARIKGIVSSSGYKSESVITPLKKVWQGAAIKKP
jgi:hypothetical protein